MHQGTTQSMHIDECITWDDHHVTLDSNATPLPEYYE